MMRFRMSRRLALVMLAVVSAIIGSGCNTGIQKSPGIPSAAMPAIESQELNTENRDTLYHALGGSEGIEALSIEFLKAIAADDRVRPYYKNTDIGRFHHMMQMFVCELAEGPCKYTGDTMKRTHGGMNIKSSEFNALVEAMMRAMDTVGLNPGVQNRLLAIMAPMRGDIVGQ